MIFLMIFGNFWIWLHSSKIANMWLKLKYSIGQKPFHQMHQYCFIRFGVWSTNLNKWFWWSLVIRVLLQILMFREKICLCKKPFPYHILITFTLKKIFFTFNNCKKKATFLFASLQKEFLQFLNVKKSFFNVNIIKIW